MTNDELTAVNLVAALAEHFGASGAIGTLEDRLAYSLDRCGLLLVTEHRLAALATRTPDPRIGELLAIIDREIAKLLDTQEHGGLTSFGDGALAELQFVRNEYARAVLSGDGL